MELRRLPAYLNQPRRCHGLDKVPLGVAPVVHHQRVLHPRIAVERPISHPGRDARHVVQLDNLVQTGALNRQGSARLKHPHPLAQNVFRFPRLEMLDDVDGSRFVRVVVWQRNAAYVASDVGV